MPAVPVHDSFASEHAGAHNMRETTRARRARLLFATLLISSVVTDCHSTATPAASIQRTASADLRFEIAHLSKPSDHAWVLRRFRPGLDSAEQYLSTMRVTERLGAPDTNGILSVTTWSSPVESTDSLVVGRRTLLPLEESTVAPGLQFRYRYRGARVTGVIQRGDSDAREISATYDEPVFAFNQLQQLVRSLRYRAGLTLVVPLFSEADAELEHDTLTVVRDTIAQGERAWIVRFADAVIVTRYTVAATTRELIGAQTRQRRSGALFWLVSEQRRP